MALAFRQSKNKAEKSSGIMSLVLDSAPLNGSALIAVVGVAGNTGAAVFDQDGASWNLLYEEGGETADKANGSAVRVQIWGAFSIVSAEAAIEISFTGAVTDRGVIVAEYTGDVFEFPNPADRVTSGIGSGTTHQTASGGKSRENDELWLAASATSQTLGVFNSPGAPFAIRTQTTVGIPTAGRVCLLDAFASVTATLSASVGHTISGTYAMVAAALRGAIQTPFSGGAAPTSQEPLTENGDHAGTAIGHLLEQFKSHDKR